MVSINRKISALNIGIVLIVIKTFASYSNTLPWNNLLDSFFSVLGAFLLLVEMLKQTYTIKDIFIYVFVILCSLIISFNVGSLQILISVLTILAIRKHDFNKIVRLVFQTELILFGVQILSSLGSFVLFNKLPYSVIMGTVRFHFGFSHPNFLSIVVFNLLIMYLWIKYDSLNLKLICITLLIELIAYAFTKTRTSLFLYVGFILLILLYKNRKNSIVLKILVISLIPIITVLLYYCCSIYLNAPSLVMKLDDVLTGRIRLGAYALNNVGITFFGQDSLTYLKTIVGWDSTYELSSFTFDCLYTSCLFNLGILSLIIVFFAFSKVSIHADNKTNLFIVCWIIYGITETLGFNCYLCFPLMLCAYVFASPQKEKMMQGCKSKRYA